MAKASSSKKSSKPKPSKAKPAAKPAAKKPAAKPAKPAAKPKATAPVKKAPAAKAPVAKAPAAPVKPAAAAPVPTPVAAAVGGDRPKPKGITIVSNKPMRKPKPPKKVLEMPSLGAPLLGGNKKWRPLIQSGPNAKSNEPLMPAATDAPKSPFNKKELERYREILLKKRHELVGDVANLEGEALNASSGSLSHTPQHIAEQGTESFDQALSLDIAQVDRNLIKEIDEALTRIAAGTYGVCLLMHKPISKDRLEELPWTKYSIEGARELERREFIRP